MICFLLRSLFIFGRLPLLCGRWYFCKDDYNVSPIPHAFYSRVSGWPCGWPVSPAERGGSDIKWYLKASSLAACTLVSWNPLCGSPEPPCKRSDDHTGGAPTGCLCTYVRSSQQSLDMPPSSRSVRREAVSPEEHPRPHSSRKRRTARLGPAESLPRKTMSCEKNGGYLMPLRSGGSLLHSNSNWHTLLECKIHKKWICCWFLSRIYPKGPEQCLASSRTSNKCLLNE